MSNLLPQDYLSNITFNEEILLNTLHQIKKGSYEFVENAQRELVGYHKFDFRFRDFRKENVSRNSFTTTKRYVLNVRKQMISMNKLAYRRSPLFMKELTHQDLSKNPDLFSLNYVVFIDGDIYHNFKIIVGEDLTRIVIYINNQKITDGMDKEIFDELYERNPQMTIYFRPNSFVAEYETNKFAIKKFNNSLSWNLFNIKGQMTNDTISFTTLCHNKFRSIIDNQVTRSADIRINDGYERKLNMKTSTLSVNVVSFKFFDRIIDIPQGGDYFELPIRKHVVPLSSFMAFYEEDGQLKYDHNLDVTYHYPNIYKVNNNDKPLKLYVFYCEPNDEHGFINELALYYRFFGDEILDRYRNGTISELVKNYKPKQFPISIKLFEQSLQYCIPIDYKTQTMNDNIKRESKNLSIYLHNMLKNRKRMKIYAKNLDLDEKTRLDTSMELPNLVETFDEEHIVLIFSKYFVHEYNMRFFIDGYFYVCDKDFHDKDYYYYYIPKRLVKENSVIEIEKSYSYQNDIYHTFDDTLQLKVNIFQNPCIASDIIVLDEDGNYLKEDYFRFLIKEDGKEIEIRPSSHKPLGDEFTIKLLYEQFSGIPLRIFFRRLSSVYEYKIEQDSDKRKPLLFKTNISRNKGHIRIYRNGRMIPPDFYTVRFKTKLDGYTSISLNIEKQLGDIFHIEFNPDVIYTNYYTPEIDNSGLLDFNMKLNKPFDLKWYDVFLNGFKLDSTNFDILTPHYAIIKNVSSTDHLLITEKNWTDDVFKFDVIKTDFIPPDFIPDSSTDDDFLEEDEDLKDKIDEIIDEIVKDETIDELLPGVIEDVSDTFSKLILDVIKYLFNVDKFINPDIQYDRIDVPVFLEEEIAKNNNIVHIAPNIVPNLSAQILVNPDTYELLDDEKVLENGGIVFD